MIGDPDSRPAIGGPRQARAGGRTALRGRA